MIDYDELVETINDKISALENEIRVAKGKRKGLLSAIETNRANRVYYVVGADSALTSAILKLDNGISKLKFTVKVLKSL